jgi:hypothetical protein
MLLELLRTVCGMITIQAMTKVLSEQDRKLRGNSGFIFWCLPAGMSRAGVSLARHTEPKTQE